jgi:hypothetical protein
MMLQNVLIMNFCSEAIITQAPVGAIRAWWCECPHYTAGDQKTLLIPFSILLIKTQ